MGIYRATSGLRIRKRPFPGANLALQQYTRREFSVEQSSSGAAWKADSRSQSSSALYHKEDECNKWNRTPEAHKVRAIFDLDTFSEEEISKSFENLAPNSEVMDRQSLTSLVTNYKVYDLNADQTNNFVNHIFEEKEILKREDFRKRILELGQKVDPSVNNLSATFFATGLSVGLIIPLMPQVAGLLHLNSTQYGIIISSFAFSKMLGNIPAAKLIDRYGRKPLMTLGLITIGLANLQVAVHLTYPLLLLSRILVGQGVAALSTAASVYLSDIATTLNRGRTIAPPMTTFTVGTAIGPAIGGFLMTNLGLEGTFSIVGTSFLGVAAFSYFVIKEPFLPDLSKNSEKSEIPKGNLMEWKEILLNRNIAYVSLLQSGYWFVLSGSQMTLMPLLLSHEPFSCNASTLGYIFAAMSAVSVVGTSLSGRLLDRYGKISLVIPAAFTVGGSMLVASSMQDLPTFLPFLFSWVIAGTLLSSGPTAFVADSVSSGKRTKALAMLRTAGDVGMLAGSMSAGMLADYYGYSSVIGSNGVGLMALSSIIGLRFFLRRREV